MTALDSKSLFLNFLNICNLALRTHKDQLLYHQLLEVAERTIGEKTIGIAVMEEGSESPSAYFTLRFQGGTFDVLEHEKSQPDIEWTLERAYLEQVVENSSEYIDHPEQLEWGWLKTKLGLGR